MNEDQSAGNPDQTESMSGPTAAPDIKVVPQPTYSLPPELQPSWIKSLRTQEREEYLRAKYAALDEFPQSMVDQENDGGNGYGTKTVATVRAELGSNYSGRNPVLNPWQIGELFLALERNQPDLELSHGGDLDYIGADWTFDVNEAIGYTRLGSGAQSRDYPTLRVVTVKDLMASIRKLNVITQSESQSGRRIPLESTVRDVVGGGNSFIKYHVNWNNLAERGCMPAMKEYKPPAKPTAPAGPR